MIADASRGDAGSGGRERDRERDRERAGPGLWGSRPVPGGGVDAFVPEQDLHDAHVHAVFKQMRGKGMSEPVQRGWAA